MIRITNSEMYTNVGMNEYTPAWIGPFALNDNEGGLASLLKSMYTLALRAWWFKRYHFATRHVSVEVNVEPKG